MKVNVNKDKAWKRILEIEIPVEKVKGEFNSVYLEYQKRAKVPGFRQGKAPLEMVKSRYKDEVTKDVLENLLPEAYQQAVKETNLNPLTLPQLQDIEFEEGMPLKFKALIEVRPEIEVEGYKGLDLKKRVFQITEEHLQNAIDYLRERNAILQSVEREARDGDFLIVDLEETSEGETKSKKENENQQIWLRKDTLLPEFYRGFSGAKTGEEKTIEAVYPQDYFEKSLAGKVIKYKARVKEIKEKIMPEVNDDFAKSLGEYKNLEELRKRIREDLERKSREDTEKDLSAQVIKQVVEKNSFTVPDSLLNLYLSSVVEDFKKRYKKIDEEKIKESHKELGLSFIRWELLRHRIAEKEKIVVGKEDRDKWVENFAKANSLELTKAKEFLAQSRKIEDINETILENKVIEFILSNSRIKEEVVKEPKDEKKIVQP